MRFVLETIAAAVFGLCVVIAAKVTAFAVDDDTVTVIAIFALGVASVNAIEIVKLRRSK